MRTMTLPVVSTAALLIVGLSGCAAPAVAAKPESGAASNSAPNVEAQPAKGATERSRVKDYATLAELAADSDLIVTATVTDKIDSRKLDVGTFTLREVTATEVHKGTAPERLIVNGIAEPGGAGDLEPGTTHLLFLSEYELERGKPTGDYVVVGAIVGDFLQTSNGKFKRLDTESPELPEEISIERVKEVLA